MGHPRTLNAGPTRPPEHENTRPSLSSSNWPTLKPNSSPPLGIFFSDSVRLTRYNFWSAVQTTFRSGQTLALHCATILSAGCKFGALIFTTLEIQLKHRIEDNGECIQMAAWLRPARQSSRSQAPTHVFWQAGRTAPHCCNLVGQTFGQAAAAAA